MAMNIVSFDANDINDGTNYTARLISPALGLPPVSARQAARTGYWPLTTTLLRPGRVLQVEITIRGASAATLRKQLFQWFDPEDETKKKFIIDDDGPNDRYVWVTCDALDEDDDSGGTVYVATLRVTEDVRWRRTVIDTSTHNVTASGQTKVLNNGGEDKAFLIINIQPTSAKSGGLQKKRFIAIRWNNDLAASKYPTDIGDDKFNTSAEVSGGDMQADGDDLRVYNNGVEIDRWLDGINTTSTKVWCNLDWLPRQEVKLAVNIPASGGITEIVADGSIAGFPSAGILAIDSEYFVYTGKNETDTTFTGVTRAAKGSSMAAHSAATIWWVQHDLWIFYGDSTLSAPATDDDFQPIIDLPLSTNTSHVYGFFGSNDGKRTGAWYFINKNNSEKYTDNRDTDTDPWTEIGIKTAIASGALSYGRWEVRNACEVTNANFQSGEQRSETDLSAWTASIESRFENDPRIIEYVIPAPSTLATWESWSRAEAITDAATIVRLQLVRAAGVASATDDQYLEAATVTLTLNSGKTPTITINAEQTNYPLDCTITNNTTGDAIKVAFGMVTNETLEVDTDLKTVTYEQDGSNQFQALTLVGGPRRYWMALDVGNNTLQFDDTGTGNVTITYEWWERFYT